MSAIAFEWTRAEAVAATLIARKTSETPDREGEFQDALKQYLTGYFAHQIHRTGVIGTGVDSGGLTWLRSLRRLLAAVPEVWLFSQQICADWRHPYRDQDW